MRVSKQNPCPICNKPDWCMIGKSLVICMRVGSPREKKMKDGQVGFIHPLDGTVQYVAPKKADRPQTVNFPQLYATMAARTKGWQVNRMAVSLGMMPEPLLELGMVMRDDRVAAFPMRDSKRNIVGLRMRSITGDKFAEAGSHQGMFIPSRDPEPTVYLPEGPTNTAAGLSLGLYCIGRPSCNGGIYEVVALVKSLGCKRAVIIADADPDIVFRERVTNAGADGAITLALHLGIPNTIITLPSKDLRDFVKTGGDRATIEYLVKETVWRK